MHDEMKSVKSKKTIFSSKNKVGGPKVVSVTGLPPVGMAFLKAPELKSKVDKAAQILELSVGTEAVIQHILKTFKEEEEENEKVDWPVDAEFNPEIKNSLSYSKMVNEVNHREMRAYSTAGQIEPVPIFSSMTGWHSESKNWRKSNLEQLGPGISLYMKMLKFFAVLFFFFILLSVPSFMIYLQSDRNQGLTWNSQYIDLLQIFNLGTLDPAK
jgi:hypothetical protein